nr:unnamed protein product [Digitaria exilis]
MAVAAAPSLALPTPPPPTANPPRARRRAPRDVVSWTSAIARAARQGDLPAAAAALSAMLSSPAAPAPNDVTLLTVLSACADSASSPLARPLALSLHGLALKRFPSHLLLSTCLARFYLASRLPRLALQLFDSMPVRSVVTYNTMISGIMRNGLVDAAFEVFDGMPEPDKVSWTALIDGCVKNGRHDEAIDCFRAMLLDGVEPDYVTLIAFVSACGEVGALWLGMWVHRLVVRQGLERNVRVANSLIDMYARCGQVELAAQVFHSMRKRTVVSWNSMIVGGFERVELRYPRALDPHQSWTLDDVLAELDALDATRRAAPPTPLKQPPDCVGGAREKAFVMRVDDEDDTEDEDDNISSGESQALVARGARFSFNGLESSDSEDELDGQVTPYHLMEKRNIEKSILLELEREHHLKVQLRFISAEVLDKHLSMVQRDHEQKSQIVECRIRDDAAIEEAKRKDQAIKEEKLKQERARQEAEARQKEAAKLAAEAQKTAFEAAQKEAAEKEDAEKEAAKLREAATSQSGQNSLNNIAGFAHTISNL